MKRFFGSIAVSLVIGFAVHLGYPALILLSVFAPAIFMLQNNRKAAFLCAFAYFAAAIWVTPNALLGFFGYGAFSAVCAWWLASALLALPWLFVWGRSWRIVRCLLGVVLGVVPPLGLIGFASPVLAAGWLFPGMGVCLGVLLTAFAVAGILSIADLQRRAYLPVAVAVAASLVCNFSPWQKAPVRLGWMGVTTHVPPSLLADPVGEYERVLTLQSQAESQDAKVVVLPESLIQAWSFVSDFQWSPTFSDLQQKHQTILIGATIHDGPSKFRNGIVIRGQQVGWYQQRVPAPVSMWNPAGPSVFDLNLNGPSTVDIGRERVGVLICYEMTIAWPGLVSLTNKPERLVGIANDWWAVGLPSVPRFQKTVLDGWARLAGIPSVAAFNLPVAAGGSN